MFQINDSSTSFEHESLFLILSFITHISYDAFS